MTTSGSQSNLAIPCTLRARSSRIQTCFKLLTGRSHLKDAGATLPTGLKLLGAGEEGDEVVVRELIEAGVDVNRADDGGSMPLYRAAEDGHEAVVKALIEAGANVNKANRFRETPMSIAVTEGHDAVIQLLRVAGAEH